MSRDYPDDVPVGELDPDEASEKVSENTGLEAYIDKDVDDVLDETGYETPPETLDCDWKAPDDLYPNDWNPNFMPQHRQDLLVLSLLDNGWTAPLLVAPDGQIIDGEHRWRLAKDDRIQSEDQLTPDGVPAGHVPVFQTERDRHEAMVATYQQNYARGQDDAQKLGELVESLEDEDETTKAATRMGVTESELEVLLPDDEILTGDTTELWEVPWDEDVDAEDEGGLYDERITMDMLEHEADLLQHCFAGRTASGLVKLARFIVETDLHDDVPDTPEPTIEEEAWS